MVTTQPRKQRKNLFNAPLHIRHRGMNAHLSEELSKKYSRRSFPVVKGDTVAVMRGEEGIKGHIGKVESINRKKYRITIDGITHAKADGTQVAKGIHPSNVVITRLNTDDPRRRDRLKEVK